MTLYAAALRLVGLSHAEAARFHDVRLDTVKSWSAGRNRVPDGAWAELCDLYARQRRAGNTALEIIADHVEAAGAAPGRLAFSDNSEWPCEGSRRAVEARIALESGLRDD